jgi:hypothetical protein
MSARRPVLSLALAAVLLANLVPSAFGAPANLRLATTGKPLTTPSTSGDRTVPRLADDRVIVSFKGGATAEKLSRVYRETHTSASAVSVLRGDTLTWRTPTGVDPRDFAKQLMATGEVANASPNYLRYPVGYTPPSYVVPNDTAFKDSHTWQISGNGTVYEKYPWAKSWWIRNVNAVGSLSQATNAWPRGYTGPAIVGKYPLRASGSAIKVAVIDTGFYFNHPDAGTHFERGSADATPASPSTVLATPYWSQRVAEVSHGTCVAGEIAAAVGNGQGTLGIANDTTVRIYKVYFGGEGIDDNDTIKALHNAADDGCKVINMSIAGPGASSALQDAIDYAYSKGCVLVAASGNDGTSVPYYPGACDHVISVGAIGLKSNGTTRARASFSNYGSTIDLVAPGSSIWGLTKPGYVADRNSAPGYTWWDGTSMASPIVAGGIAWLWRAVPSLSNAAITSLVESTARRYDTTKLVRNDSRGFGEFDMDAAYKKLVSQYPILKRPVVTPHVSSNARNQRITWTPVSGYSVKYDVMVDGGTVFSGMSGTSAMLPHDTTIGTHTVTVTPRSTRNWADGTEAASVRISPTASFPQAISLRYYRGQLLWSDTEAGTAHTDMLEIDGGAAFEATHGAWSTHGLSLSPASHTATLTVTDGAHVTATPATLNFTIREAPTVARITATDDFKYAVALSAPRTTSATSAVLVGTGSWTDAAVAGPLARVVDGPVLVTGPNSLPWATRAELDRLHVSNVIIVGSTTSVTTPLQGWLARNHYNPTRLTGTDRFSTADAVARAIATREGGTITGSRAVFVGDSVADALSAGAVAAREGWPLMFAGTKVVPWSTKVTLKAIGATTTLLVAQTGTVPDSVKQQLPGATRITSASWAGVGTALAAWATSRYPADFSGERIFLANPGPWSKSIGVPAAAAREGALVLTTGNTLAAPVSAYYKANSEVAVRTRVMGGASTIADAVVAAIRKIVGAP